MRPWNLYFVRSGSSTDNDFVLARSEASAWRAYVEIYYIQPASIAPVTELESRPTWLKRATWIDPLDEDEVLAEIGGRKIGPRTWSFDGIDVQYPPYVPVSDMERALWARRHLRLVE